MERCLGCMNEFDAAYDVCPHCGYVKGTGEQSKNHLSPGTILIDRYLIGRCLGQGGFGITYIAWDQRLYKKVAIKEFMPVSLASRITGQMDITCYNDEAQARFQNGIRRMLDESRRLARFNDLESVVKVYDCFEANQTAYIIMELLDGENIKTILSQQGPIEFAQTVRIILPVLQALREIHASGLIHRDISPDNIFVCKNGKVKLLDFGSARVATGTDEKSLSVILKPGYAPKEQYAKSAAQGPYTDVYAVCATIYKMLTGITPIDSLERRVQEDELAPIETLVDIPPHIAEAINRGLAVEAEDRWQTVDPLLEALQEEIAELPHSPKPPKENTPKGGGSSGGRHSGKGRSAAVKITAACLAVLVAGGAGFAAWHFLKDKAPSPPDDVTLSEDAASAEEGKLLTLASAEEPPMQALPQPDERETLRQEYADDSAYVPQQGGIYIEYTDADGRVRLRDHVVMPHLEAQDYTLYAYNEDGKQEAAAHYLADGTLVSAERYLYKSDGSLYTVSYYEDGALTNVREITAYDDAGRPAQYTLHYGSGAADESGVYIYNNTVEIEKRTDASGTEVYKRTHHLEDNMVTEVWYSDGEEPKAIISKQNAGGQPTERVENIYGMPHDKCTWKYDADGLPVKHTLLDKDNKQIAAVLFQYEDGALSAVTTEKSKGQKDCQWNANGEYILFEYDEQGNETLREKFDADDAPIAATKMEYDGDKCVRTEFLNKDGELDHYRDEYTYYTETSEYGKADGYTEYDAQDRKLYTILKGERLQQRTEYDASGRETYFFEKNGDRLVEERKTAYLENDTREETHIWYDETGKTEGKNVDTYRGDTCTQEERYDDNETLRLRRKYDQNGAPTELSIFDVNGKLTDSYVLETGRLLGVQVIRHTNGSGRLIDQIRTEDMNWYRDY